MLTRPDLYKILLDEHFDRHPTPNHQPPRTKCIVSIGIYNNTTNIVNTTNATSATTMCVRLTATAATTDRATATVLKWAAELRLQQWSKDVDLQILMMTTHPS